MILYKLEWHAGTLYVGAENMASAVLASKLRGYGSDPARIWTVDYDLVVADPETNNHGMTFADALKEVMP